MWIIKMDFNKIRSALRNQNGTKIVLSYFPFAEFYLKVCKVVPTKEEISTLTGQCKKHSHKK